MLFLKQGKHKNVPDKILSTFTFQTDVKVLRVEEEKLLHRNKDHNDTTLFSKVRSSFFPGREWRAEHSSLEHKSGNVYYKPQKITDLLVNGLIKKA